MPSSPRKQGAEGSWKPHAPGLFSSVRGTGRKQWSGPGGHGKWRPQGLVLWPKDVWGASPLPPKWSVHPPGQRHPHPSSGLVPPQGRPGTREALSPEQTPVLGPALLSHGVENLISGTGSHPEIPGPLICPARFPRSHPVHHFSKLPAPSLQRWGVRSFWTLCPHPDSPLACRAPKPAMAIGLLPRAPRPPPGAHVPVAQVIPGRLGDRNESPLTCRLSVATETGDEWGG